MGYGKEVGGHYRMTLPLVIHWTITLAEYMRSSQRCCLS